MLAHAHIHVVYPFPHLGHFGQVLLHPLWGFRQSSSQRCALMVSTGFASAVNQVVCVLICFTLLGFATVYQDQLQQLREANDKLEGARYALNQAHREYAQLLLPQDTASGWVRCAQVTSLPFEANDPHPGLWCRVERGAARWSAPEGEGEEGPVVSPHGVVLTPSGAQWRHAQRHESEGVPTHVAPAKYFAGNVQHPDWNTVIYRGHRARLIRALPPEWRFGERTPRDD